MRPALLWLLIVACLHGATSYVPATIAPPPVLREFRGAWVATLNNIDWPSKRGLTTAEQKQELLALIDKCAALKLNVIILQVRPGCDALYASKFEPWSEYLTGTQGQPPNPFWDPLEFAVTEAHRRGLELHAWFNPFRARHSTGSKTASAGHLSRTRPELVRTYGSQAWLDPGLAEAHDHSMRVILDVVQRYDVDGVHVDDYFYPYPEPQTGTPKIPFPDTASWTAYQRTGGRLARDDWRRDNVNRFIARMYREVHEARPWVKVGISPFGIYRPGFPAQIKGLDQFQALYADPKLWLAQGWLDYLAPQLYWRIDPPAQSFPVLLKWWVENNPRQRTIVAGLNTTAISAKGNAGLEAASVSGWPTTEISRQIALTRQQAGVSGHIHWNMSALMKNKGGISEQLRRAEYQPAALAPALPGVGAAKVSVENLSAKETAGKTVFSWSTTNATEVRFWVVQSKQNGAWQTQVIPKGATWSSATTPEAVSVRAVDRSGRLGAASSVTLRAAQALK